MVSRVACSVTSFLLWSVLVALLVLPISAIIRAELNCMERKCVEIPFVDNGEGKNTLCVRIGFYNGTHYGKAYGSPVAIGDCYGQNSVGGKPSDEEIDQVDSHCWRVRCQPDCGNVPLSSYCSGIVLEYVGTPQPSTHPTRCKPDPAPDPGPEPDPEP
ncbi:MAG: hypothetical protein KatS3mg109_2369 [Pirellulaceae bacterium]|nr:MAG: hypothetical protein KatS3mg109_2369 [Pirellulaceae bacterium]